jgi:hypothetical protein
MRRDPRGIRLGREEVKMRMNTRRVAAMVIVCLLAASGCKWKAPITKEPTRKTDARLLGTWLSAEDKDDDARDALAVLKCDESHYVVLFLKINEKKKEVTDGVLTFRAHHSDLDKTPFVTVQDITEKERKYLYYTYGLSKDGKTLTLRVVNDDLVPRNTESPEAVRKLLRKHAKHPKLFEEEPSSWVKSED